jgi:hypothetical protein
MLNCQKVQHNRHLLRCTLLENHLDTLEAVGKLHRGASLCHPLDHLWLL